MVEDMDKAVVAVLRRLPEWRGKSSLAMLWKAGLYRRRASGGSWTIRMIDGSTITGPSGSDMTWAVAASGHWDRHIIRLVSRYVTPGSLVLDVGASFGLWTIPLGRHVQSLEGLLWSFEPNPDNVRWLVTNIAANNLADVVHVRAEALGAQARTARLSMTEHGGGNGALDVSHARDGRVVRVTRLDDLTLPRQVSFIKLDVEGFELEVLRGAINTIKRDRPVIFGEFSAEWLRLREERLQPCLDAFADLSYDVFAVHEARSTPWRTRDRVTLRPVVGALAGDAQNLLLIPTTRV
jgi:FkbM family methyltransferase